MDNDKTPISWLLDALCECGLDRAALMDVSGIGEDVDAEHVDAEKDERDDAHLVTLSQNNAIYAYASRALDEPAIGLAILDHVTAEKMGLIGLLTEQGPTMRKSLFNLCVYQPIFSSVFVWSMELEPEQDTRLIYKVVGASPDASRHDIEFSLGIVVRFLKHYFPDDTGLRSVEFAFPSPSDLTRYHNLFGSDITFDAPRNSLVIGSDVLDRSVPGVDASLSAILEAQAKRILDDLNEKPELVRQVETIIALGLGHESTSIDNVASRLFMHARTLHRRLIQHGTSFRQLKDNIVIRSAQDALLQTDLSVTDIALKLGYSENSAFTRTFKRVCDVSPSQYRRVGREHI